MHLKLEFRELGDQARGDIETLLEGVTSSAGLAALAPAALEAAALAACLEHAHYALLLHPAQGSPSCVCVCSIERSGGMALLHVAGSVLDGTLDIERVSAVMVSSLIDCTVRALDLDESEPILVSAEARNSFASEPLRRRFAVAQRDRRKSAPELSALIEWALSACPTRTPAARRAGATSTVMVPRTAAVAALFLAEYAAGWVEIGGLCIALYRAPA